MKKFTIVFANTEEDQRLFNSSVKALSSDALSLRYAYSVSHDTSTEKTTLTWWRKPTGGWNEKQSD